MPAELFVLCVLPLGDAAVLEACCKRKCRSDDLTGRGRRVQTRIESDQSPSLALGSLDESENVGGRAPEAIDFVDDEAACSALMNLGKRS